MRIHAGASAVTRLQDQAAASGAAGRNCRGKLWANLVGVGCICGLFAHLRGHHTYVHDPDGRLVGVIDASGNVVTYVGN